MKVVRFVYRCVSQVVDPFRMARAVRGLRWFFADYRAYKRLPGAEKIRLLDLQPALHERGVSHEVDAHYFYANPWAVRRILAAKPARHVDVASQTVLATMLSATIPVTYIDYRVLNAAVGGLQTMAGDLTRLPLRDASIESLSCIHVAEHVGLGRYGDPIDPHGTRKAAAELSRVLATGGNLYFALPVGRPMTAFNAHRIHAPETIVEYFPGLQLRELSGVGDDGRYHENVPLSAFRDSSYACGLFHFTKPAR